MSFRESGKPRFCNGRREQKTDTETAGNNRKMEGKCRVYGGMRGIMIYFNCDYHEGAHERIMEALMKTNREQTTGYGMDPYCLEAAER